MLFHTVVGQKTCIERLISRQPLDQTSSKKVGDDCMQTISKVHGRNNFKIEYTRRQHLVEDNNPAISPSKPAGISLFFENGHVYYGSLTPQKTGVLRFVFVELS